MTLQQQALRQPNDPFDHVQRVFDGLLGGYFDGERRDPMRSPYPVDVREDTDHLYVEAELPGFKKEDVEITLEHQTLTIAAQRTVQTKPTDADRGLTTVINERRYGRFFRAFTLPPTIDEKKVDATLNDGVLKITLNKREETKPRKIAVS